MRARERAQESSGQYVYVYTRECLDALSNWLNSGIVFTGFAYSRGGGGVGRAERGAELEEEDDELLLGSSTVGVGASFGESCRGTELNGVRVAELLDDRERLESVDGVRTGVSIPNEHRSTHRWTSSLPHAPHHKDNDQQMPAKETEHEEQREREE